MVGVPVTLLQDRQLRCLPFVQRLKSWHVVGIVTPVGAERALFFLNG